MQGNWSSFQVDFGYTELFHIPVLTTVSFKPFEGFLGDFCSSVKQIKAPYMFDWEQGIALHQCRGIGPHISARGKFHGFSQVAVGTWGTFSSYGRGSH